MISNIYGSQGITVMGSSSSMPYINMSNASAGMLRYNNNNIEVYDGHSWLMLPSTVPSISLSPDVLETIAWANLKRAEEMRLKVLAEQVPVIADLKQQLDMMIALCKD